MCLTNEWTMVVRLRLHDSGQDVRPCKDLLPKLASYEREISTARTAEGLSTAGNSAFQCFLPNSWNAADCCPPTAPETFKAMLVGRYDEGTAIPPPFHTQGKFMFSQSDVALAERPSFR
jgi:hypothetical protein